MPSLVWIHYLDTPKAVVTVTERSRAEAEPLLGALRGVFLPNRILAVTSQRYGLEATARLVPIVKGKLAQKGRPTACVREPRVRATHQRPRGSRPPTRKVRKLEDAEAD